jgi:sugar lactone lactonase YvrE
MEHYNARVVREGLAFGEGPRWHEGRLWFSDFYRHAIFSIDGDGTEERKEHDVSTSPRDSAGCPTATCCMSR